jgi:hypothetical protein
MKKLSRKILRQRERESAKREREIRELAAAANLLESGKPIPGVNFPNRAARDRMLRDLLAEMLALVRSELKSRPDLYVQDIGGGWSLVETRKR